MEDLSKEIPLTQGKAALVDADDYERLNKWKWYAKKFGKSGHFIWYAARTDYSELGKRKTVLMHREVLTTSTVIDHIDNNGLNNQKINLRDCSQAQNTRNKKSGINSNSKYLGVDFMKRLNKWRARIMHNGKSKYIGLFGTELEAAIAYDESAKTLHGDFSNLNFK